MIFILGRCIDPCLMQQGQHRRGKNVVCDQKRQDTETITGQLRQL